MEDILQSIFTKNELDKMKTRGDINMLQNNIKSSITSIP